MQLGTVHLGRMGGLLFRWGRRMGTAQKALPHGLLGQRLGATLLDQTLHDLMLCAHGSKNSPASYLAVGSLRPVTAVQTWMGGTDGFIDKCSEKWKSETVLSPWQTRPSKYLLKYLLKLWIRRKQYQL